MSPHSKALGGADHLNAECSRRRAEAALWRPAKTVKGSVLEK